MHGCQTPRLWANKSEGLSSLMKAKIRYHFQMLLSDIITFFFSFSITITSFKSQNKLFIFSMG